MPKTTLKVMFAIAAGLVVPVTGALAAPKLDKETCEQLKGEQAKFMASGIVEDIEKGPEWGKGNLPPERLREIEHFIMLDEQLKFGCRMVTMTADVFRASEEATKLEAPPEPPPAPVTNPKPAAKGLTDDGPVRAVTPKPSSKAAATAAETKQPAAAAPAPKPKPKPSDAYVPERSGPPVNP